MRLSLYQKIYIFVTITWIEYFSSITHNLSHKIIMINWVFFLAERLIDFIKLKISQNQLRVQSMHFTTTVLRASVADVAKKKMSF